MVVVDADAHVNENPVAWKSLGEKYPDWLTLGESGGKPVARIDDKLYPLQEGPGAGVPIESSIAPVAMEGAFDVNKRLVDMDTDGIDIQVMYGGLSIGITGYRDPGFALDFARAYNDWLLDEVCAAEPKRLKGVATVPLQDVDRSIGEMQRAVRKGAVAVTIPPVVGDRNLDDPTLLPFFEAAADAGVPLGVHSAPGMNLPLPAADRFSNYVQVHTLSFPVDQMVAFTALSYGGVLDRLPKLKVAFLEAGVGWVPFFLHRVLEHREKRGDLVPLMTTEDPQDYLDRGQCWFTFECEEPLLEVFVERHGPDSAIFASDYPHWDTEFPGTVAEVRERYGHLGDDVLAQLLGSNAMRLYNLTD